jgi:methanogenic corrinoid protein MtbC1
LQIYRPDGQPFLSFVDLDLRRQAAEQRADTAEQQAQKLAAKLKELGIDPANL